jgi:energy-coupling factor transporter ATP-binding protein EcfA2
VRIVAGTVYPGYRVGSGQCERRCQVEEAVLITGVYGSGKSSVAEEMAAVLEEHNAPYALLDLDFLAWFDTGGEGGPTEHRMMLTNLAAVVGNYLTVGVRFFVLAKAVRDAAEVEDLRAGLPMPLKVVRLTVPLEEVEERLSHDVTTGRRDDLREAAAWVAARSGVGIEDLAVSNDRPIREVAADILSWLGCPERGFPSSS